MRELVSGVRSLNAQVWTQAIGRLLCQIGYGLISFYLPILFVNQIGLSAAAVGFSIGLSAVSEVLSHFLGGILSDSPRFGRKLALLLAAGLGMAVTGILAISHDFWMLTLACLLLGLSLGFYWTASSAAVIDATDSAARPQAFALMGVAEYVGIGIGVLSGGAFLLWVGQTPQQLFILCGAFFLAFLLLIQFGMAEQYQPDLSSKPAEPGIWVALRDQLLLIFLGANIFYATYVAIVNSTIPLYFTNFVEVTGETANQSITSTASLFTACYIGLGAVLQLPIAHYFARFARVRVLMAAMLLWAIGFSLLWAAGTFEVGQFAWGMVALCILSIASVAYKPFSVAIVSELSPESARGTYMAVSSQAWTVGYFVGPTLGGWAMDQPSLVAQSFWLVVATSTIVCILLLWWFERLYPEGSPQATELQSQSDYQSDYQGDYQSD